MSSVTTRVEIVPSGKTLGAEIRGVDLRKIKDSEFAAIYSAWLDRLVVLLRGQQLTDEDLIAFSRRLGDLDWAPVQETGPSPGRSAGEPGNFRAKA